MRIERAFNRPERLVQLGPEHLAHEWTAYQPVAVLARQRASELEDEIRDVVGDRARTSATPASVFRLMTGRTCRQPTDAWAYTPADVPCRLTIDRKRAM